MIKENDQKFPEPILKRIQAGYYTVGTKSDPDRWVIEERYGQYWGKASLKKGKWMVIRFGKGDQKDIREKTYYFHWYRDARDHAMVECAIEILCTHKVEDPEEEVHLHFDL